MIASLTNLLPWGIGALVVLLVLPALVIPVGVYIVVLTRFSKEKWGRACSLPEDPEISAMFDEGVAWARENESVRREVSVVSDGFKLAGEYFDFGGKDCVIVIAGRTECLLYSYYFAQPYHKAGLNVLVIDNRSHGLSEGKINSLGYKEYRDIIAWAKMLHEELGNERVVIHGICIGSSTGVFALASEECPDYLDGLVAEGMYVNFYESFKNHMIEDGRPLFPTLPIIVGLVRLISGADMKRDGPLKRLPGVDKPILFLHSRKDTFSVPEKVESLVNAHAGESTVVWFESGVHSRIRPVHKERYDEAVVDFCRKYYP